jgi:hypothetical protein
MFETAEVGGDGKCPAGFSPANPPSAYYETKVDNKNILVQCLKIKVGQHTLVIRNMKHCQSFTGHAAHMYATVLDCQAMA